MLTGESNIFYHPNLERKLVSSQCSLSVQINALDTLIGTTQFHTNQFDLNFVWQKMENYHKQLLTDSGDGSPTDSISSERDVIGKETNMIQKASNKFSISNLAARNYCYFTKQSGIDFKSSTQLIFDVLMQILEVSNFLVSFSLTGAY